VAWIAGTPTGRQCSEIAMLPRGLMSVKGSYYRFLQIMVGWIMAKLGYGELPQLCFPSSSPSSSSNAKFELARVSNTFSKSADVVRNREIGQAGPLCRSSATPIHRERWMLANEARNEPTSE
jgi:hypothetical protein